MEKKRMANIDILKVIGLLLIMLAHVNPPQIVFQLRNFDVVLMIIVSAYLGLITYKKTNFFEYLKKRFTRLVIPTWIFLIFFFILNCIFNFTSVDLKKIIESFAFANGIGYVWIIRIYFIVAILIPISIFLNSRLKNDSICLMLVFILMIGYEILCNFGLFDNNIIQYLIAYFIPCFFLVILAKHLFTASNKKVIIVILISLLTFSTIAFYLYKINGEFVFTQDYKYPFRAYYLSYGIMLSSILILILRSDKLCNVLNNKLIGFISSHSLWIYLWHILVIYILKLFDFHWVIKCLLLIIISCFITYCQKLIVSKINNKSITKLFDC